MDRMKSLLSKNLKQFLIYATIILLCCSPLFFFIMKYFYTEDLDELISYRSNEFIREHLPGFTVPEIELWNKYNEDIQVLPDGESYIFDKTGEEFIYNKAEGHPVYYRILYKKIEIEGRSFILLSRIPMIETKDMLWNLFAQYGLIFLILLFSLAVVQRVISKKSWAPFYNSLSKIENYSLEQGIIPDFEKTDIKEFNRLNDILTGLISNNLKIYKQQKEFIENASHELQTPLAVFQSQLDILLQEPDLSEKQVEIIQSLYTVSSRLTRLNKNLLLLAKIDNAQFKEIQEINFTRLLKKMLPLLTELAENSNIHIETEIKGNITIRANMTLVESLINNLIINAIRHNVFGGYIKISVQDNTFIVANTGEDNSLDKDRIFRRFSRISEERKGNGLGLSIIKQICKFHKWRVEYNYSDANHQFIVYFCPDSANRL